jgi:alanyl-tRNA synthetase
MLQGNKIREKFLKFFERRNHAVLPSASLVTTDTAGVTNATLFNSAGMQPLVPYLLGEDHPEGSRLASSQKCLRTGDLDEVGDNTHLTFFEMLGNWSLGDYFKKESIAWSWEFLTDTKEGLGLDPKRMYVTVFAGNDMVPRDDESVEIWKQFVPEHRIYYRSSKDNWWTAGSDSPAGPSTEIFYDVEGNLGDMDQNAFEAADEEQKVVELWNNVFMSYRQEGGEVVGELPRKNVDTGAGLERVTAVVQGVDNIYETDLFAPLIDIIREHSEDFQTKEARIVADHIKTAVFMLGDEVAISNTGRGYVLRRILRRAYHCLDVLGMSEKKVHLLVSKVIDIYRPYYFKDTNEKIMSLKVKIIATEMDKLIKIIKRGNTLFSNMKTKGITEIDGTFLADARQTKGLPLSVSKRLAAKHGIHISKQALLEYEQIQQEHKKKSQQAAAGKFKGGLTDDTPKIRALHTATHLMLAGLRKYLGDAVEQRGSNITEERTRFDVSYDEKIPRDVLDKVEAYVNEAIASGGKVGVQMMDKQQAQSSGNVVGSFWERYPDTVTVYQITGPDGEIYSRELCGGPHAQDMKSLAQYGTFVILKEESSSAGVRRIKATFRNV